MIIVRFGKQQESTMIWAVLKKVVFSDILT
jgi:hypothetical protein